MGVIFSNVPPLKKQSGQLSLAEYIEANLPNTDMLCIAVGYASRKSLLELDTMIRKHGLARVVLILGMYAIEGFPEGIYNTAMDLNAGWKHDGIGEIRVTPSMKYHGKIYGFYRAGRIFAATVGSHNLGSISVDPNNLRQYEISVSIENEEECQQIDQHLQALKKPPVSCPIDEAQNLRIVHEENKKLNGVEGATKVSAAEVDSYKQVLTPITFNIQLKVPGMPDSNNDYMKSNINKCYAKGRLNTRTGVVTERGWWETEVIVSKTITSLETYPKENEPFYVITDDGWKFLMHVSGDYKKNFESDGDLKILGYWLKGRLVAAGIVEPVDSPSQDLECAKQGSRDIYEHCKGVISYQKLLRYGRTELTLTKTPNKLADENGILHDVWMLSFLPKTVQ